MKRITLALCLLVACSGGGETDTSVEPPQICDLPYANTLEPAEWALQISPTRTYLYEADVASGFADIHLLDADDTEIATMRVRQVFDQTGTTRGAMEATLNGLTLTTVGRWGGAPRYTVEAELTGDGQTFQTIASFDYQRCFNVSDAATVPPCADSLDIGTDALVLPSCGLVADNLILDGVAPVLSDLEYRWANGNETTTVGGRALVNGESWHQLGVRERGTDIAAADVETWLSETGADAIVGTADEVLLTTAFLDRTWWREMDKHIGYCGSNVESEAAANIRRQALGSGCPGDHSTDDWDQGGGGGDGNNAWGDPHLTTLDGHAFDFQGGGEFALVRSTDAALPLEIQFRTEPRPSGLTVCGDVSWVTAVATTLGDRRIAVYAGKTPRVRIDGVGVEPNDVSAELPAGASLSVGTDLVEVHWPDGSELWVRGTLTLSLGITLATERAARVTGMLGNFDGRAENDHLLLSGDVLGLPVSFADIHGALGDSWRVDAASSLFDYDSNESPNTFALPGFPAAPVTLEDLPAAERELARTTCVDGGVEHEAALSACILDTVCVSNPSDNPIRDARQQPLAVSHQAPGVSDAATGGAVERKPIPALIDDTPWESPNACAPRERRHIGLYLEGQTTTVADVDVDASDAGRYDDVSALQSSTIPAGTDVQVWLLNRTAGTTEEGSLNGFVQFAAPVLGIAVSTSSLDAGDTSLGASTVTYSAGTARGPELGVDWFELSADRRRVQVSFKGAEPDQLRIITEVSP